MTLESPLDERRLEGELRPPEIKRRDVASFSAAQRPHDSQSGLESVRGFNTAHPTRPVVLAVCRKPAPSEIFSAWLSEMPPAYPAVRTSGSVDFAPVGEPADAQRGRSLLRSYGGARRFAPVAVMPPADHPASRSRGARSSSAGRARCGHRDPVRVLVRIGRMRAGRPQESDVRPGTKLVGSFPGEGMPGTSGRVQSRRP